MDEDDKKIEGQSPSKWYEGVGFVIFILLFFGPLGLPLLFKSRHFSRRWKWILSVLIVLITIFATLETVHLIKEILRYYRRFMGEES